MKTYQCNSLSETQAVGAELLELLSYPACVYLQGQMGAGKTSLCQGIIQAAGYSGLVTSPTYNLIHEYPVATGIIYHLDLYRLEDPAELEFLGLADLWQDDSLILVEWPDKGLGYLQAADFIISIQSETGQDDNQRTISFGQPNP